MWKIMILFFLLQNIIFRRAGPAVSLFRETLGLHGRRRRVVASSQLLSRYRLFIIDFSMSKHSVTREERESWKIKAFADLRVAFTNQDESSRDFSSAIGRLRAARTWLVQPRNPLTSRRVQLGDWITVVMIFLVTRCFIVVYSFSLLLWWDRVKRRRYTFLLTVTRNILTNHISQNLLREAARTGPTKLNLLFPRHGSFKFNLFD